MRKRSLNVGTLIILIIVGAMVLNIAAGILSNFILKVGGLKVFDHSFKLISSTSNEFYDSELKAFAKKNKINLTIDYYGDLEIVDILNSSENDYDGVWISNSIWLYMLNNSYLVTDSKSIAINPVVMAVKKSKAQSLGFTDGNVYNKDILSAIKNNNLNYVMTSVTKTNTGATAYLGFLNSLAGSPEVLNSGMLSDKKLIDDLKAFFKGVDRVSGDESYLTDMFINGDYEAMINYESTLIQLNKTLTDSGKEPLYLVYPTDGVAINDMPFGYVDRNQDKKDNFNTLLDFLRSRETRENLETYGLRTWFGGTKSSIDKNVFNSDWGIDTSKYLMPLKYPSKTVISEALDLYVENLRKPSHTVFVLDVSGSMSTNNGLVELQDSMNYILNKDEATKDRLQFSKYDKITVITFNSAVKDTTNTYYGDNTSELINYINRLVAGGGTNIYDSSVAALKILASEEKNEYNTSVILMTDGASNNGNYFTLSNYYLNNYLDIPVYSITFGSSNESQLEDISSLTNGKIFDGKSGLKEAFTEVRSYS